MRADLQAGRVVIVAGFQGIDSKGDIATLGRGGSDTCRRLGRRAESRRMPDLYRCGRRIYHRPAQTPEARRMDTITFEEMLELASLGSKAFANPPGRICRQIQSAPARIKQPD